MLHYQYFDVKYRLELRNLHALLRQNLKNASGSNLTLSKSTERTQHWFLMSVKLSGGNVPFQGSIHLVSGVKMYLEKNFAIPAEAKVSVTLSQKTDGFQNCKLEAVCTSGICVWRPDHERSCFFLLPPFLLLLLTSSSLLLLLLLLCCCCCCCCRRYGWHLYFFQHGSFLQTATEAKATKMQSPPFPFCSDRHQGRLAGAHTVHLRRRPYAGQVRPHQA